MRQLDVPVVVAALVVAIQATMQYLVVNADALGLGKAQAIALGALATGLTTFALFLNLKPPSPSA